MFSLGFFRCCSNLCSRQQPWQMFQKRNTLFHARRTSRFSSVDVYKRQVQACLGTRSALPSKKLLLASMVSSFRSTQWVPSSKASFEMCIRDSGDARHRVVQVGHVGGTGGKCGLGRVVTRAGVGDGNTHLSLIHL